MTSTTGAINGTVTDSSKAIVPGVTITLAGPALMSAATAVTDQNGRFRFSTLPVGDYHLTFELAGFGTVKREGIRVSAGFTATVNVVLNPGTLEESVTVSGASPVVDVSGTSVASRFDAEKLAELPGSRDAWAIIAAAPAVAMSRMDVGGSGAWTQQSYRAYGISGGERNEVEGIVVNEGSGQMYYTDFGSFNEISVTPAGNTAEVGTPGVYSNFVSKSGSNTYHGNVYFDYENDAMEARNIDDAQIATGIRGSDVVGVRDLNRLKLFRDFTADIGGYLKKDKLWWYFSYRNNVAELRFPTLVDDVQTSEGPGYTAKVDANLNANHKFVGYYQFSGKHQDNYLGAIALPSGRNTPAIMYKDTTWDSGFPVHTFKGEYNGVFSDALLLVVRAGGNYSTWWRDGKSSDRRIEDIATNFTSGGLYGRDNVRGRPQANGALSYFKDGWGGSHNLKVGGEIMYEIQNQPFRGFPHASNSVSVFNNRVPSQVYLFLSPNTAKGRMSAYTGYLSDTWRVGKRLTLNLGLRFDRFRSFLPEQEGPGGEQFAANDSVIDPWNNWGPRLGASYDIRGDGKTVVKVNYGKYWLFPAADVAGLVNPNSATWFTRYAWDDLNRDGFWNPGEEGRVQAISGGTASTTLDPNLENSYQHQLLAYVEREVAPNFGVRTGFVWNGRRQPYGQVNVNRPLSSYGVPTTIQDPGPDGVVGTADDGGPLTAYNLDTETLNLPVVNITQNLEDNTSDYYTWEITATRRQSGSWSLLASFAETWSHVSALGTGTNFSPNALINTTDGEDRYKTWQAKLSATLLVPGDVRLIPLLRHQAGNPFARTFSQRLNFSTVTIKAEPFGAERTPHQTLLDLRTEKSFEWRAGVRVTAMFDVYNIFNSNAEQDVSVASGSAFLRPAAITPPRIARVGLKLNW